MRKRLAWIGCFTVLLVVATAVKHRYNEFGLAMYDAYNGPVSVSSEDAKHKGVWVASFKIEPDSVTAEGKTFEFDEAWLEAVYVPTTFLVWISYERRADWNYLVVRPKTEWLRNKFSYEVEPEFAQPLKLEGPGSKGDGFTMYQDGRYFQKVPTSLRELKLKVSASVYATGNSTTVGIATLTKEE